MYVTAHRCWSKHRRNDPGEEVWFRIVEPMMKELGLELLEDWGNGGRPIPAEWMS